LEVGATEHDFGAYLNWLHFGEATLTFPQTIVLRYSRFEAPERRLPQAAEDYQKWFLARLRAVDAAVSERDWLCADRFTAADISVGYALMLADYLGMAPKFPAAVSAYFDRLKQLESFRRSLQAEQQAAILQDVDPTPAPLCAN
jgi:glutathione S-transferase